MLLRLFCLRLIAATRCCAEQSQPHQPARSTKLALESAGIRKLTSKHLVLYTDVPSSPEVDRLPAVFDQAVPQWAEYFGIDPAKTANWQAAGVSHRRPPPVRRARPDAGRQRRIHQRHFDRLASSGCTISRRDYYRRHLLLHEGTHVFMVAFLGGCGPGWYMEGTAELFGTHRSTSNTGQLTLRIMPRSRDEVPMLGRIKLIHDAIADDRTLTLSGRDADR